MIEKKPSELNVPLIMMMKDVFIAKTSIPSLMALKVLWRIAKQKWTKLTNASTNNVFTSFVVRTKTSQNIMPMLFNLHANP